MKEALYMTDSYIKTFEAEVESISNGKYVVLSQTAFYPQGGGQLNDEGILETADGTQYRVLFVGKFDGKISHEVDKAGLKAGDKVTGKLDWERRYTLMRMHTASHVISSVFHDELGAKITGNQLSLDKLRIDFNLENFDRDLIDQAITKANVYLAQDLPVTLSKLLAEEARKDPALIKLAGALPPNIPVFRIVSIGDVDKQADGGTHVHSTKEVGQLKLLKAENKGKNNRRIYLALE
jgi:misacylated tRNA(Ala) deacylase